MLFLVVKRGLYSTVIVGEEKSNVIVGLAAGASEESDEPEEQATSRRASKPVNTSFIRLNFTKIVGGGGGGGGEVFNIRSFHNHSKKIKWFWLFKIT